MRARLGAELRLGRIDRGLSQDFVAAEAGMSRSQLGRIERAQVAGLRIEQVCRVAAAVGLAVSVSAHPDGDPARDRGQLRLERRLRPILPPGAGWQTEVPMPIPGDRRAWDAVVTMVGRRGGFEFEMKVTDIQSLQRRLALKLRDGAVDVMVLVVADTAANRRILREHREELRELLPLDSREVLACLRAGRLPGANGIVVL
jgi:transcriptional regulator with XRE-family HTH domain